MKPARYVETAPIPDLYAWFATEVAPTSRVWEQVCLYVARTSPIAERLAMLPGMKRQPNLFLAALKYLGAPQEPGPALDAYVAEHWSAIEHLILTRRTQTNEVGRCAVLAPVLAALPQPLALIEVGASAGVCLAIDLYGYRWNRPDGTPLAQHDPTGTSGVTLDCIVTGSGLPLAVPTIAWRAGVDLNPLDPADPDTVAWLRALVWPGEAAREARLVAALGAAAAARPQVVTGDATEALPDLVAQAPAGATVVVLHSAVLAYLDGPARQRHVQLLDDLGVHWVTNEGALVVPGVRDQVGRLAEESRPHFVLALDGHVLARVGPHGAWLAWI